MPYFGEELESTINITSATAVETITLAPLSETDVFLRLPESVPLNSEGILEPLSSLLQTCKISGLNTLVTVADDRIVSFRAINLTDRPTNIYPSQRLAFFHTARVIEKNCNAMSPYVNVAASTKLPAPSFDFSRFNLTETEKLQLETPYYSKIVMYLRAKLANWDELQSSSILDPRKKPLDLSRCKLKTLSNNSKIKTKTVKPIARVASKTIANNAPESKADPNSFVVEETNITNRKIEDENAVANLFDDMLLPLIDEPHSPPAGVFADFNPADIVFPNEANEVNDADPPEGPRRGKRRRIAPIKFWDLKEFIEYENRHSGTRIKNVVRVEDSPAYGPKLLFTLASDFTPPKKRTRKKKEKIKKVAPLYCKKDGKAGTETMARPRDDSPDFTQGHLSLEEQSPIEGGVAQPAPA
eukprot:gene4899-5542_t